MARHAAVSEPSARWKWLGQEIVISISLCALGINGVNADAASGANATATAPVVPSGPDVPAYVPAEFDCAWRRWAFARLRGGQAGVRTFSTDAAAFDGLQIATKCNDSYPGDLLPPFPRHHGALGRSDQAARWYVDPHKGNDGNSGSSEASPFATVHRGITAARAARSANPTESQAVLLRGGATHYLGGQTVSLTSADSGLTIGGYGVGLPVVSGATAIRPQWTPHNVQGGGVGVWKAMLAPDEGPDEFLGLRVGGERQVRARWPNANPETQGLHTTPSGWVPVGYVDEWLPGVAAGGPKTPPIEVMVTSPNRADSYAVYPYYTNAIGGICNGLFEPNVSFWCNPRNPRDGARGVWNGSGGIVYTENLSLPTAAAGAWDPVRSSTAVAHVWHSGGHWATMMYSNLTHTPGNRTVRWRTGGFQDARASSDGAEWYLENLLELLDSPGEWWFDASTRELYLYYNGTGTPPSDGSVVATGLETLLEVRGTQAAPVRDVTVAGVQFADASASFMKPHGVPSSGDWGLRRNAAIVLEGVVNVSFASCRFIGLDGNGMLLSGYTRNVTISDSEFAWIGGSAMSAWGSTDDLSNNGTHGYDATPGDFPRHTLIDHVTCREVGIFQKQASCWFQAKAMQTTIRAMLGFNGPRAGICFNDGFGGANVLEHNVMWSWTRESSDHGVFNSWDRQMYLVEQPEDGGTPSVYKQYDQIHHNILVANYPGAQEAVDNDDGSGYFNTTHNVVFFGHYGMKVDMAGHDNMHVNNLYAYLFPVCFVDLGGGEAVPTHRDLYANNTCIQGMDGSTYAGVNCNDNASMPTFHDNRIYNPSGVTSVCGVPLARWQAEGHDPGTTVHKGIPDSGTILAWADQLLDANV